MISQIKSKDRVKELAEVYTNIKEINEMLDFIDSKKTNLTKEISTKFLEPSCGNGNFLLEILRRKLTVINIKFSSKPYLYRFYTLKALSSIYGIDICPENISEAKTFLKTQLREAYSLNIGNPLTTNKEKTHFNNWINAIDYILNKNLICADTLKEQNKIFLSEFSSPKVGHFKEKIFLLSKISELNPTPEEEKPTTHFQKMGVNNEF